MKHIKRTFDYLFESSHGVGLIFVALIFAYGVLSYSSGTPYDFGMEAYWLFQVMGCGLALSSYLLMGAWHRALLLTLIVPALVIASVYLLASAGVYVAVSQEEGVAVMSALVGSFLVTAFICLVGSFFEVILWLFNRPPRSKVQREAIVAEVVPS